MNSSLKTRLTAIGLALLAAAPFASGQDNGTPPAPPAAGNSSDQTPPPPRRGGRDMLRPLLAQVSNLTDSQKATIMSIQQNTRQQGMAIRQDQSLSQEDRRAKMEALMKSTNAQVRAVLTPDQQKQWDAAVAAAPRRGGGRRNAEGAGAPPADAPPPPPPPPPAQ